MSTKPKVLVTRISVPGCAIEKLRETCDVEVFSENYPIPQDVLKKMVQGKDVLYCLLTDSINKDVLDAAGPNLKIVCTMSVGYDHMDMNEINARGIKSGHTPVVSTDSVAELTVALLLATCRRLFDANKQIINGGWGKVGWCPMWMCGVTVVGATVGVFGLGRIGFAIMKHLRGFEVKKFIYNDYMAKDYAAELGAEFVSFEELVTQSDFIVVASDLNDSTRGIFNADAFGKMKKDAIFVNTSRGGLVDQEALMDALKAGKIRGAGLDVMDPEPLPLDHPLLSTPNLTLLPHVGSAEKGAREKMAMTTANNILAALNGQEMEFPIRV